MLKFGGWNYSSHLTHKHIKFALKFYRAPVPRICIVSRLKLLDRDQTDHNLNSYFKLNFILEIVSIQSRSNSLNRRLHECVTNYMESISIKFHLWSTLIVCIILCGLDRGIYNILD